MPTVDTTIYGVIAREILDSRGNPTIEAVVILNSGYRGKVSVPSGASVGKYEAVELRDGDTARYNGLGVKKAVENINMIISPKIRGMNAAKQSDIDHKLIELDGTPNKAKLGANATLAVSLGCAVAVAEAMRLQPYQYIHTLFTPLFPGVTLSRIPTPMFNVINGGKHGGGNLNFQEYHVIPATNMSFSEGLQIGVETYHEMKKVLANRNAVTAVGDEGGYTPNLFTNQDALDILLETIRGEPYQYAVQIFCGLDVAASEFKTEHGYQIKDRPAVYPTHEFIAYLVEMAHKYQLLLLEDPLDQDDWDGWIELTKQLGQEVVIIGDDLIATNKERLQKAIDKKACNAIIIKPNQIGTLTETLEVAALAKKNTIQIVMSHRSGETTDSVIADLGVAVQAEYVKFGAPARGERIAKYNRLLEIESLLKLQ